MTAGWCWYVARPNEIFLDLDSVSRLFYAMRQVERNRPRLEVRDVHVYPSGTPKHYHMIVRASEGCRRQSVIERALWAQHCGSDRRRAEYIIMRALRGKAEGADFLITPQPYPFRKPDRACGCEAKHKDKAITDACPVMGSLLGEERSAEYFEREPRVQFAFGQVSLDEILKGEGSWINGKK